VEHISTGARDTSVLISSPLCTSLPCDSLSGHHHININTIHISSTSYHTISFSPLCVPHSHPPLLYVCRRRGAMTLPLWAPGRILFRRWGARLLAVGVGADEDNTRWRRSRHVVIVWVLWVILHGTDGMWDLAEFFDFVNLVIFCCDLCCEWDESCESCVVICVVTEWMNESINQSINQWDEMRRDEVRWKRKEKK
jgi:hypothetical protein